MIFTEKSSNQAVIHDIEKKIFFMVKVKVLLPKWLSLKTKNIF